MKQCVLYLFVTSNIIALIFPVSIREIYTKLKLSCIRLEKVIKYLIHSIIPPFELRSQGVNFYFTCKHRKERV